MGHACNPPKGARLSNSDRPQTCRSETVFQILPYSRFSRSLEGMEVHFTPETEKKLQDLAAQSGRGSADELVQDVVERYFDELAQTRDMLSELALCVRPCRLSYRQLPPAPRDGMRQATARRIA